MIAWAEEREGLFEKAPAMFYYVQTDGGLFGTRPVSMDEFYQFISVNGLVFDYTARAWGQPTPSAIGGMFAARAMPGYGQGPREELAFADDELWMEDEDE